jgi:hypothetical protein
MVCSPAQPLPLNQGAGLFEIGSVGFGPPPYFARGASGLRPLLNEADMDAIALGQGRARQDARGGDEDEDRKNERAFRCEGSATSPSRVSRRKRLLGPLNAWTDHELVKSSSSKDVDELTLHLVPGDDEAIGTWRNPREEGVFRLFLDDRA